MKSTTKQSAKSDREFRIDVRGRNGKVSRVQILARKRGGEWHSCDGEFTAEDVVLLRKFAKVVAAVARGAAPPFDLSAIVRGVDSPRRSKRKAKKPTAFRLIPGGKARVG